MISETKTQISFDFSEPEVSSRAHAGKARVADLAIAGGTTAFSQPVHVGRPNLGDRSRLAGRIADVLDRRWLTNNGRYVREFEQAVCEQTGVDHCVAMSSGTVALQIATRALGLTGEVLLPSFTFVATAHALEWQGMTPVFCDVDPETHTLDPARVEERITSATTGILGVHLWGQPANIEALSEIASRHGLKLVFDAAHAFGCSHKGRMIGGFGEAEVFSFHATKFVNAFEGGAVTTNNRDLAERLRLMRNFGFTGEDHVVCVGTNGKMSEVSGAMGVTSLESVEEFVAVNRAHYQRYQNRLGAIPGLRLLPVDEQERRNYQYVVLEVDSEVATLCRDALVEVLREDNILARRYFFPGCHWFEPYRSLYPESIRYLPVTERLAGQVVCLPTGTDLSSADVDIICDIIELALAHGDELRDLVRGTP